MPPRGHPPRPKGVVPMGARTTLAWHLLDLDGDPVPGDPDRVKAAQSRYENIAKTIHDTADNLRKVTGADGLKGQYADAIKDKATDVVNDLTKASGRYDAVAKAVGVYQPALETARTETAAAVSDAETANAAQIKARAMPDPSANRPPDAPPLSQDDQNAVGARNTATANADGDLAKAKARLRNAVEALNAAGQALANAVGKNAFKGDHLTDSGWDRFLHGLNAFLKVFVKVLQWIGIALAALALIFPGVGVLIFAGVIIAVTVLVADIILVAQGETSWFEVAMSAAGVVLLGAGGLLAKGLQSIGTQIRAVTGPAFRAWADRIIEADFVRDMRAWMAGTSNRTPAQIMADRDAARAAANVEGRTGGGLLPEGPQWWQFRDPGYRAAIGQQVRDNNIVTLLKDGKFAEYFKFFAGVDVVAGLRAMGGVAARIPGSTVGAPSAWYYGLAGGLGLLGWATFGISLA